jgi:hypothetical protein
MKCKGLGHDPQHGKKIQLIMNMNFFGIFSMILKHEGKIFIYLFKL